MRTTSSWQTRSGQSPIHCSFLIFLALVCCGPAAPARGQTLDSANLPAAGRLASPNSLQVDVNMVLVPVLVTDSLNRPVMGLDKLHFAVFQDEEPQEICYFSIEDTPISVGLLLDLSKSMSDKFDMERTAVSEFFKNADPQDDYFVITFANRPKLISDAAQSIEQIQSSLASQIPDGNTALLDAISLGVTRMLSAQYRRRALLIISDGGDNHSRHHRREIEKLIQESDVDVYAIGIFDSGFFKTSEESMGRRWLNEISGATGGHVIAVNDISRAPEAAAVISREMRERYILGYRPASARDGYRRTIRVQVSSSDGSMPLHTYYKTGYISHAMKTGFPSN
jgi:Ca-activated chloride channel family protein